MPPEPPIWILQSFEPIVSPEPLLPHIALIPGNVFNCLHTASFCPSAGKFNVNSTLVEEVALAPPVPSVGKSIFAHTVLPFTVSSPFLFKALVIFVKSLFWLLSNLPLPYNTP